MAVKEEWLRGFDEEGRHERRIATEDELRKPDEMRQVWTRNARSNTQLMGTVQSAEECVQGGKPNFREAKWNNACCAQQITGQSGRPGASSLACVCMECKHMPKDDFVWFAADCHVWRDVN